MLKEQMVTYTEASEQPLPSSSHHRPAWDCSRPFSHHKMLHSPRKVFVVRIDCLLQNTKMISYVPKINTRAKRLESLPKGAAVAAVAAVAASTLTNCRPL